MNGIARDSAQDQIEMVASTPAPGNHEVVGRRDVEARSRRRTFYDSAHWWWPYWNDWRQDDTHAHVSVR